MPKYGSFHTIIGAGAKNRELATCPFYSFQVTITITCIFMSSKTDTG
jgi:hypothetical protein